MKKRIQKYLAGEREGFSLVELIIVIAIMAILIGVIALAVIPNIQRSRESKDISMLDSIASAANAAIATNQITGSDTVDLYTLSGGTASKVGTPSALQKAVYDSLAADAGSVGSSAAKDNGAKITLTYNTGSSGGAAKITVKIVKSDGSAVPCGYLTEPSSFEVTN